MTSAPQHSPEYLARLRSPEWRDLRLEVLARSQGRCERCEEHLADEIHHLHYRTLGRETPADLQALCVDCHARADVERRKEQQLSAYRALENARFEGWARKVYGPEWQDYAEEAEEAFESWLERKRRYD